MPITDSQVSDQQRRRIIGRLYARATNAFQRLAVDRIRAAGFPDYRLGDNAVIIHLELAGSRTSAIAKRAGVSKQAIGQLVKDLEKRGVVERTKDPADGRAQIVQFTDYGRRMMDTAFTVVESLDVEFASHMGEDRAEVVRAALIDLLAVVDPDGF